MFVRTRPEDGVRVIVTQTEANRIENDYRILGGAREPDFARLVTKSQFSAERTRLKTSLLGKGGGPSDDDVKWAVLHQKAIEHANNGEFGLSRNTHFTMAEFLARRWRLRDALGMYLYVCILDLNGVNNVNASDAVALKMFPPFTPANALLAPVALDQIARIAGALVLGRAELRAIVEERSPKKLPLSAEQAWSFLESALWPAASSLRKPVYDPACVARAPTTHEIEQTLELPGGKKAAIWRDARAVKIPEGLVVS
jgi:hypothetical protein